MARLGAMVLSLTKAEMRAYFYLIKSAPHLVSRQKLTDVILEVKQTKKRYAHSEYSTSVICNIKKKLGKYHGIKNRFGSGYYYEETKRQVVQ